MPSLGTLTTHLALDGRQLHRGAARGERSLGRLGVSMRGVVRRAAQLGTAVAAAGTALVIGLTRRGLQAVDAQSKLARSLGGTIDGVRGLQIAAEDAGVSTGALESAMGNLARRLGEAHRGSGQAAEAMERLGLNAAELIGMDVDTRMATIADRINEMGLSSAETADLLGQLGIRNREMILLMQEGGDAIRAARDEVEQYGLSLNAVDAAAVERANDAFSRIGRIIERVSQQLAVQLAPYIEYAAAWLNQAAVEADFFTDIMQKIGQMARGSIGAVADYISIVSRNLRIAHAVGDMAFSAMSMAAWSFADAIWNGPVRMLNSVIDLYNRIPGLPDVEPFGLGRIGEDVEGQMRYLEGRIKDAQGRIREEVTRELPTTAFDRFVENAQRAAAEARKAVGEPELRAGTAPAAVDEGDQQERDKEAAERHKQMLEARIERIREANMEEAELAEHRHEKEMEKLQAAKEAELLTEEEFNELKEDTEARHQENMADIRQRGLSDLERFTQASYRKQAQTIAGELKNMTASVANENRAMFEINKAAAIGMAMINTKKGIAESLGAYPWPLAGVMAAAHGAAGMAQVSALRGQSYGGGGSTAPSVTPAGSGAGAGSTPTHEAGGGRNVDRSFHITGISPDQLYSGEALSGMLEAIEEASEDGRTRIRLS